ncbi:YrdB family protein [Paenibacillus hexagrammi]|uniref:YrdB family protein n=1 Tax=Paenibacillus hexagrammi TaxID=2908839 RepID=A0ABY3SM46_9BACL|nr:YrdB family protein [Paenibacillus sp. YPD9-1]UJF34032.1 YrdB family protein [Paenibacillus sp. YPD9-1]
MYMVIKMSNLGLRFLLELCILASLGYWGFTTSKGILLKIALGLGAPLAAAVLWGMFVAPKATFAVSDPLRFIIELIIFSSAFAALSFSGHIRLTLAFAIIAIVNRILMALWNQ